MKTIPELMAEIKGEQETLEALAFEIYCKRELTYQMEIVDKLKEENDSAIKKLNSLDIEKLTKDFNSYSCSITNTPKEAILKEMKNNT